MDPKTQIDSFIDRYSPEVARDARAALSYLRKRLPTATQLVYDNYNALVITFGTSNKPSHIILSIALYPRYVTLFFARGTELPDPRAALEGSGSTIRGSGCGPFHASKRTKCVLIAAAISIASPPLPPDGSGPLIVKSISAKQRPRRPQG